MKSLMSMIPPLFDQKRSRIRYIIRNESERECLLLEEPDPF